MTSRKGIRRTHRDDRAACYQACRRADFIEPFGGQIRRVPSDACKGLCSPLAAHTASLDLQIRLPCPILHHRPCHALPYGRVLHESCSEGQRRLCDRHGYLLQLVPVGSFSFAKWLGTNHATSHSAIAPHEPGKQERVRFLTERPRFAGERTRSQDTVWNDFYESRKLD